MNTSSVLGDMPPLINDSLKFAEIKVSPEGFRMLSYKLRTRRLSRLETYYIPEPCVARLPLSVNVGIRGRASLLSYHDRL